MIFSVRDESLHSEAGCKLFRELVKENPDIWTTEFKNSITKGVHLSLENEFAYIESIFEMGELETISKHDLKNFMYDRANRKLIELGLDPAYKVDQKSMEEMSWFYIMVSGEQQTDFFDNRETGYAKPNEDWNSDDLF